MGQQTVSRLCLGQWLDKKSLKSKYERQMANLNHAARNGVLQWQTTSSSAFNRRLIDAHVPNHEGGRMSLTGVTMSDLNQNIFPCFRTNHLQSDSASQEPFSLGSSSRT